MKPSIPGVVGEATSLAERKRMAGQRLLIGVEGHTVCDDLRALVREIRPAGFVLFARNVAHPGQVAELNRELAGLVDPHYPAYLAVDQEGGRVQRIKAPATEWPTMRTVGRAQNHTAKVSKAMARELLAMGFNLNLAPVADVDSNPNNPVIGDRAFGSDPQQVAEQVAQFVRAHQSQGILACAKHFPGHGDTATDSHLDLPTVGRSRASIEHTELPPFRAAIRAGVGAIMTSHVVYPAFDPDWPATLSSKLIGELLRQTLGFAGLVLSDDLDMKAMTSHVSLAEQVRRMNLSGVDLLLCCRDVDRQYAVFQQLVREQESDKRQAQATAHAVERIQTTRSRFSKAPAPKLSTIGHPDHLALAEQVAALGAFA